MSPDSHGYIWYRQMPNPLVEGLQIPVPVFHSSRPPTGWEASLFTYKRATEVDEHWVGVDLVVARQIGSSIVRAMNRTYSLPILP